MSISNSNIRLNAKTIREAQAEVKAKFPNGGKIKGWFEDIDVEDKQVYEADLFKRERTVFRRKTHMNQKKFKPDFFTVEPNQETGE